MYTDSPIAPPLTNLDAATEPSLESASGGTGQKSPVPAFGARIGTG